MCFGACECCREYEVFFFFSGNVLCVFVCMCDVEALLPKDCAIFLFTCVRMCMYM